MSVLFLLIAVSLLVAICFLAAFLWATSTGQYEDEYADSVRMLFDDQKSKSGKSAHSKDK